MRSSSSFSPPNRSRDRFESKRTLGRGLPRTAIVSCEFSAFLRWMATTEGSALAMVSATTVSRAVTRSIGATCGGGGGVWDGGSAQIANRHASEKSKVIGRSLVREAEFLSLIISGSWPGGNPRIGCRFLVESCQQKEEKARTNRLRPHWQLATGNSRTVDSLQAPPDSKSTGAMRACRFERTGRFSDSCQDQGHSRL